MTSLEKKIQFDPLDYHFQSPLGSIVQYTYTSPEEISKIDFKLTTRKEFVNKLKNRYGSDKLIVGISWQGGARGKRLNEKSIPLELLQRAERFRLSLRKPSIRR